MKKLILVAAATLGFAFLFTSCDKKANYTCECTYETGGQSQTVSSILGKTTKSEAKKLCQAHEDSYNQSSAGIASAKCTLK